MPTAKPRKPWRVILTGPLARDGASSRTETEHVSEREAYNHLLAELRLAKKGERPYTWGGVMRWRGARWWHFETFIADEIPE